MKARKKRVPSKGRRAASDVRKRCIAEAAYLIAESEGFPPGRELAHWLLAEAQFERLAAARARRGAKRGLA